MSDTKTCFSTLCCLDEPIESVISYALSNNMNGVELRVNEKNETFDGRTVKDAPVLREMFEKAGLKITDLALSCSIKEFDKSQIKRGKDGIDFAAAAGSGAVRIFVGEHQSRFSKKINTDLDGITESLTMLSDYGKSRGVEIWLETHSCFSSGKAMGELVGKLGRDNIKVIWDVMHSLEYNESPADTLKYLSGRIVHVHLKDGRPGNDPDVTQYIHTDLGKGSMPVTEIISILEDNGFDGFYSLEWESPWRPEIRDLYKDINHLLASYNRFLGLK